MLSKFLSVEIQASAYCRPARLASQKFPASDFGVQPALKALQAFIAAELVAPERWRSGVNGPRNLSTLRFAVAGRWETRKYFRQLESHPGSRLMGAAP